MHGRSALLIVALFASFCAGVIVDRWVGPYGPALPAQPAEVAVQTAAEPVPPAAPATDPAAATEPLVGSTPPGVTPIVLTLPVAPPTIAVSPPTTAVSPVVALEVPLVATPDVRPTTRLRMPIDGVTVESMKGGFAERRGDRAHDAVDMVVPRGTPIHAVQDGTIAKLFYSQLGGITIYQFDQDGRLCFYYAHLQRYADGLHELQQVSKGEVIGYVGTSGNSPAGTPHLHFEIHALNVDRRWWQGRALDPYLLFKEKGSD
jgi:murein DD-endopeptidase MepM/ murein hydrolase activator NlpD